VNSSSSQARLAAALLFFFSGAASLVYEVLWTRQFELILGATTYSAGVVLAAYMAGLFLGSRWGAAWTRSFRHPLQLYGLLEMAIGLYAFLLALGFHRVDQGFLFLETHWPLPSSLFILPRFLGALALLVLPTTFMGATLPCLSNLAEGPEPGKSFAGGLYAANTAGAVAGAVAAGYWLLPAFGQRATTFLAVLANAALGLAAWALGSFFSGKASPGPEENIPGASGPREAAVTAVLVVAGLSGAAAMMDEVGYNRVLSMVLGGSVYAFSAMLASFLAGLSAGAFVFSRSKVSGPKALGRLAALQAALGAVVILTGYAFDRLWLVFMGLAQTAWHFGLDLDQWQKGIQFLVAFGILFPTAFLAGSLFPLALKSHPWFSREPGEKVGRVYAANTLGAIAGSLLAAFFLIPLTGVRQALVAAACLNFLAAGLLVYSRRLAHLPRMLWPALAALGLALAPVLGALLPAWNNRNLAVGPFFLAISAWEDYVPAFRDRVADSKLLYYREGLVTTVTVEKAISINTLVLSNNGKVEASSLGDLPTEQLAAHLPLLWRQCALRKPANRVAVIGLASGITSGTALQHDLTGLDVIEMEPFMPKAAALFHDYNFNVLSDPKFRFIPDDARHYFRVTAQKYDVIVSEPSNPWLSGVSNLFTRECFEIGKGALAPGGVYCQWLQIYGMKTADVKAVCRTFSSVFPYVYVFGVPPHPGEQRPVPDLFLLGSMGELRPDIPYMERVLREPRLKMSLKRVSMEEAGDLVALLRMGPPETRDFCAGAPLNTDDNGLIEFSAPLHLYDSDCYVSNMMEIRNYQPDPAEDVNGGNRPALKRLLLRMSSDLKDYWGSDFAAELKKEAEELK
jgi:spermidine synthase